MTLADFVLDVDKLAFDRDGVPSFFWPISRAEALAMASATRRGLVDALHRSTVDPSSLEFASFSAVSVLFAAEAIALYTTQALNRRGAARGLRPVRSRSRSFGALVDHGPVPRSPSLGVLQQGIRRRRSRVRAVMHEVRRAQKEIAWNGPSLAVIRPFDREKDIAALQWGHPLIARHASIVKEFVRAADVESQLDPISDAELAHLDLVDEELADAGLEAISAGFDAGGESLTEAGEVYLHDWLAKAMGLVAYRLRILESTPAVVPLKVWTGTGGSIWNRIKSHATLRAGGVVTRHDHGVGAGFELHSGVEFGEYESCSEFVALSEGSAAGLRKVMDKDLLVRRTPPVIFSLPNQKRQAKSSAVESAERPIANQMRTIMYVSSFYTAERATLGARNPDIVQVDWEARLFSHLQSWGFEVLHKPHPASIALPHGGIAEAFGGKTLTDRFEQVADLADGFMFIDTGTSTLIPMLASRKPAIYVNIKMREWDPEAFKLLQKRCAIVDGWFDDENRIQVRWDKLRFAIEEARSLTDTTIVSRYWEEDQVDR